MKRISFVVSALIFVLPVAAHAQSTVTFGGGASGSTTGGASASGGADERGLVTEAMPDAAAAPNDDDKEWLERDRKMNEASTLTGGIGLLHTQHAQGGAVGQFRVGFTTEYFSAGFLCTPSFPCADSANPNNTFTGDSNDHIGGHLTLSMQVTKWLEPYLATSATANSNPANRPSLLQVLGDSYLGAKAHGSLGKIFNLGGAFELWLVNGTGSVGLSGGGTSAKFRGLATADLRGATKPIPLRFSINGTYVLDNTAQTIADTETARGTSITRIERFGLDINRVDHFDIALGGEVFLAKEKVRPFIEYVINVPVNRQGYLCRPNNPSKDNCLANDAVAPSSLTLGGRFYPWKRGFNLTAAFDIGISGTSEFIEEVRPTPPWMLYLGAGWAFDTVDRPPVVREHVVEKTIGKPAGHRIHGFVHEEGTQTPVVAGIVSYDNHPEITSMATGTDGRFTTQELDEGPYVFGIKAEGYKPGQCTTTVVGGTTPAAPPPPAAPGAAPAAAPPPVAASGGSDVQLDCVVQALPRTGNIIGHVHDADGGGAVPGALVKIIDAQRHELSATADATGTFHLEAVPPGEATVSADADGYLALTTKIEVKARKDNDADVALKKRPKNGNVTVGKTEIVIKQQIQFALDSAVILPESNGLLSEIADAIIKNPRIHRVEVQGHTDNSGTVDHNLQLSDARANAVVSWLTSNGVGADRLLAKGYGQSKPLVPNVTAGNRARNRRVQFIILDQDPAASTKPR